MRIFSKTVMTLACLALFAVSAHASATAVYIAQNAAGAANGADCADAQSVSFFNSSGNWGAAPNQIGPGTTVHLCGTFTGAANSTMLTVQGSGASGSPVTILFEPNALLQAPYWAAGMGAIYCANQNYIVLDGGSNGLVQNTANGTGLAFQAASNGVYFYYCNNIEIRNLRVNNIYAHSVGDNGGEHNNSGIGSDYGDHVSIHNNTVTNVFEAIGVDYIRLTDASIYNNKTDYHCWGIGMLDGTSNASATGVNIYGNTIGPHFQAWADNNTNCHNDGMILNAFEPGSTFSNANIYNNTITGDMCSSQGSCTAYLFFQGTESNVNIFNNVLVNVSPGGFEALIVLSPLTSAGFTNFTIANNTMNGNSVTGTCYCSAISLDLDENGGSTDGTMTGTVIRNNIIENFAYRAVMNTPIHSRQGFGSVISSMDNNLYYNISQMALDFLNNQTYYTLLNWQSPNPMNSFPGFDKSAKLGNPNLNSSYIPQSGSPAVGVGANLTSLNISGLDYDITGAQRPSSGPWVAGAYLIGGTSPVPPSNVVATVQ